MQVMELNQIKHDDKYGTIKYFSYLMTEDWYRYIPENIVEQEILFQSIAYNLSENSIRSFSGENIPIPLENAKAGYIANLSFPREDLNLDNSWLKRNWDGYGRLEGIVSIYFYDDRTATLDEEYELSHEPSHNALTFPVFYSVMSSLNMNYSNYVCILCEFQATPFSKLNQCDFLGNGLFPLGNCNKWFLPRLSVPPDHEYYQTQVPSSAKSTRLKDISEYEESTEDWLAGMDPRERAATEANLNWDD